MSDVTTLVPVAPSAPPLRSRKGHPTRRAVTAADILSWPAILTQELYTRGEVERFLAKVDVRGADECWPWTAGTNAGADTPNHPYGLLSKEQSGRSHYAHRMSRELATGQPLGEVRALHTCDHSLCCNPAHSYAGSQADNVRDMDVRGRRGSGWERSGQGRAARQKARRGQAPPAGKTTAATPRRQSERDIRNADIRARYAAGGVFLRQLGEEYGLTEAAVCRIVKGNRGAVPVDVAA